MHPQFPLLSQVQVAPWPQSVGNPDVPASSPPSPEPPSDGAMQRNVQKCVVVEPSDEHKWAIFVCEQSVMLLQN